MPDYPGVRTRAPEPVFRGRTAGSLSNLYMPEGRNKGKGT